MARMLKSDRYNAVRLSLLDTPDQTRTDLDLLPVYVGDLITQGVIKVSGKVETNRRGRPAHKFRLTDKGRKQAKRLRAAQEAATPEATEAA